MIVSSTGRLRRQHWSSDVVRLKAASRLKYRPSRAASGTLPATVDLEVVAYDPRCREKLPTGVVVA
ncbi:hypothetical protein PLICRDRAFT_37523 [Plicaturopsis crispa FD-325 SS-3]|nr:hypothetical protein PLICRDRAFT_37523 [Plicaturopsis crispa FD-325 SS-3]